MSTDPFASPEFEAMQDAEMELHIAADRWHDFPADPAICADLHRKVVDYRRVRAAWVQLVGTPDEAADLATDIAATTWPCVKCQHTHASPAAGGICIGCPCEERR